MGYIENPKTKGSGILCCIPQTGRCPKDCKDCFFQGGRSYLEPLDENLPNMPSLEEAKNRIIRINDGNDSNIDRDNVIARSKVYSHKFYNTSIPHNLAGFDAPVVLTVNGGILTDSGYHRLPKIPENLMYVRVRTNMWNLDSVVNPAVDYYSGEGVPVVLTFMAYFTQPIPEQHKDDYIFRKRTLNEYWAITTNAWRRVMARYEDNMYVYSCGKIEGEKGGAGCPRCGNCIREYFNTLERMRK